ncbi:hypothetical protein Tco_0418170 [Tanacetum coccineum]
MTRSSTKELLSPFENPEQKFRSRRRLFDTPSLVESNSLEFDHNFDIEEQSEEEVRETITETREQYMSKTRGDYGSGVTRPSINQDTHFELKEKFLKEFRDNTFSGSEHEDAKKHIKKVLEIVDLFHIPKITQDQIMLRAFPVGCELCKGPYYTKDCPQKEEGKTLEEAYYTQFGAPYQPGRQYRATGPGFYQRNNGNSSYPDRRPILEESLTKFMAELAKRHEENSNIIKVIRASTDAAIRNQGASIKTLEIQIGQMSKIRHIGCGPYAVSGTQQRSILSETVPFPRRLQNFSRDDWREAQDVKILDAYDHTLPQKEKDPGSFTLHCFIHNIYFDKALVDLGESVSVMPFFTYTNLGLGILSHTRLTIELADRTIKQPRGIAENVLVRIGKFIFPIDFIILDIPEDDDVPLILGRPFLSTAHSKIDVFKRNITLREQYSDLAETMIWYILKKTCVELIWAC